MSDTEVKSDANQSAVIVKLKKTYTEHHIPADTENDESEKTSLKQETLKEEATFGLKNGPQEVPASVTNESINIKTFEINSIEAVDL